MSPSSRQLMRVARGDKETGCEHGSQTSKAAGAAREGGDYEALQKASLQGAGQNSGRQKEKWRE